MTIHKHFAFFTIACAFGAAIGLDHAFATVPAGPTTSDIVAIDFVPQSFDVEITPLEEPRIAGSDVPALAGTPSQVDGRFEH